MFDGIRPGYQPPGLVYQISNSEPQSSCLLCFIDNIFSVHNLGLAPASLHFQMHLIFQYSCSFYAEHVYRESNAIYYYYQ